jgi:putative transposase
MPRMLRLQYPGAIYHLTCQADGRQKAFRNDVDRLEFLKSLGEACQKTGWQVHAYCLMPDHYHLVLETPEANLAPGMAWFQSAYTIRFNLRHKHRGRVFSGRYKSQLVEGGGKGYVRAACDFVHLSPVRAQLLSSRQRLRAYPWSSLPLYLSARKERPEWLRVERLLGEHGIAQDSAPGRSRFERAMEQLRQEKSEPAALRALQRGWCLGSGEFKRKLLSRKAEGLRKYHTGGLYGASGVQKAKQIVAEELKRRGWDKSELNRRRRSDPAKLEIAARLRLETTLPIRSIAARLKLGTFKGANGNLHRFLKSRAQASAANPRTKTTRRG